MESTPTIEVQLASLAGDIKLIAAQQEGIRALLTERLHAIEVRQNTDIAAVRVVLDRHGEKIDLLEDEQDRSKLIARIFAGIMTTAWAAAVALGAGLLSHGGLFGHSGLFH